ncbi:hypothetical protein BS78_03G000400 [Paspalum vaginatum]|nr:hypothetical protein BS78_03G000400 [Paspalum vaginatum]
MEERRLLIFRIISIISKFAGCQDQYDYQYVYSRPPVTHVMFDFRWLTHEDAYFRFIKPTLRNLALASGRYNPQYFIYQANDPPRDYRYLLGQRRAGGFYGAPYSWMEIHLIFGDRKHERCTLCMATDDLYVLGFRNGTGQFYGFKGKFKGFPRDAKILPFTESYNDLRTGGAKFLAAAPRKRLSSRFRKGTGIHSW